MKAITLYALLMAAYGLWGFHRDDSAMMVGGAISLVVCAVTVYRLKFQ